MATVFSYHDSRAVFSVAIGARENIGVYPMDNLIETALFKARSASERASAHIEFMAMLDSAGMTRLVEERRKAHESESRMADSYYAMASELSA